MTPSLSFRQWQSLYSRHAQVELVGQLGRELAPVGLATPRQPSAPSYSLGRSGYSLSSVTNELPKKLRYKFLVKLRAAQELRGMISKLTRAERTQERNKRIRDAFYERYTLQPRPKKYTREYVVAQLAEEYCLSMATVERIVLPKTT